MILTGIQFDVQDPLEIESVPPLYRSLSEFKPGDKFPVVDFVVNLLRNNSGITVVLFDHSFNDISVYLPYSYKHKLLLEDIKALHYEDIVYFVYKGFKENEEGVKMHQIEFILSV